METIFISSPLPDDVRQRLESEYNVEDVPPGACADLSRYGDPAGWLMDARTTIDANVIAQLPSLRVVSNHGVGYDSVDVMAASAAGVVVANTPGVLNDAVAELAFGLMIALGRGILNFDRYVRDGSWEREQHPPLMEGVHGKTLGVVGMGRIGKRLSELVQPFGMPVIYHNRSRNAVVDEAGLARWVDWEELLQRSDFVALHTPLTERTRGLFTKSDFALMKSTAYLLNMARGGVVNTDDLLDALRSRRIAGAALDVFDLEPLPASHPLLALNNVIVQPHNGSATIETRRAMVDLAIRNLTAGIQGVRPETAVNWDDVSAK